MVRIYYFPILLSFLIQLTYRQQRKISEILWLNRTIVVTQSQIMNMIKVTCKEFGLNNFWIYYSVSDAVFRMSDDTACTELDDHDDRINSHLKKPKF